VLFTLIRDRSNNFDCIFDPCLLKLKWLINNIKTYSYLENSHGLGIFLFTTAPTPVLGPTTSSCAMGTGASYSHRVKRVDREAHNSPPSSAEVKNAWSYTCTPPIRLNGVVFI
jgi:hypothetical protein